MLGLAIADNFASGNLPPFKLVEVAESLGLGPVHPDHASPMEIITGLLADLPPEQTDPTAVATAHADILDSEFKYQWFEAGEALEDLLHPVKGYKQRVATLMKVYLPERRLFGRGNARFKRFRCVVMKKRVIRLGNNWLSSGATLPRTCRLIRYP
jgi:hypothetical protein